MKTLRLLLLSLLVVAATAARAADATPVFNALMTMGKEHRFVLISTSGKASSWLSLGSEFDGYKIKAYDDKSGGLDLERDGKVTRVMIVGDAATQSSGAAAMTATPATLADAENVLKLAHFEDMMSKIVEQQKKAMMPAMARMLDQMKVPEADRERVAAMQKKIIDEAMDTLMGPEMKADLSRIYSSVFTKEELTSLSAFYSTPTGQAMVAKQPQIQEQMMQSMMPKMMQIGPKLQDMAKGYMMEKQAAAGAAPTAPAAPAAPKP